jgi:hypothetical protein
MSLGTVASKSFYVYLYSDPRTGLPFYVGKGTGRRAFDHLKRSQTKHNRDKRRTIEAIRQAGLEPQITIPYHCEGEEEAFALESFLIHLWGRKRYEEGGILTNLTVGGEGRSGFHCSEETKQRLSISCSGYKHTEDARKRMSIAGKGRKKAPFSDAHKSNISKARTGLPCPEVTKQKLSKRKGSLNSNAKRLSIEDPNGNVVVHSESIKEFAAINGYSFTSLWRSIKESRELRRGALKGYRIVEVMPCR